MSFNEDKFSAKKGEMIKVTPQCVSCKHYEGPMKCEVGIVPNGDVLLNRIKCRKHEER